jgi:hypothetical protein
MVIDFQSAAVHSLILFPCARIYRFSSMPRHILGRVMKCGRREVWQVNNCPLGASFFLPLRPPSAMWNAFIAVWFVWVIADAELSSGRIQIRPIDFGRKKPIFLCTAASWNAISHSLNRIAKAFSNSRKTVYRWQFLWWSMWPTFVYVCWNFLHRITIAGLA